ncbi:DUF4829 domain-containing protein [Candidatus Pacearchaeota archaeon]|nr:DUF4829 domain-containing protein [Candidatus Pacearchaeota archaeon]MBI2056655.1 DUF4829 domain-containing protein [Candidatus Pacearchaeota archaeon]
MKNDLTNKKILYIGLTILFVIFIVGIIWTNNKPKTEEFNFPSPEKVVEQYFNSWNNKDYANMYAVFSDGFKKIEPTAKTLQDFKEYVDSQNIEGIEIVNIEEKSNNGETAGVDYKIIFTLSNNQKSNYDGTFTLKYRKGDVIQGWKLIHPYGENIDAI